MGNNKTDTPVSIRREDLSAVLEGFGISKEIRRWHILTDWQERRGEAVALRIIVEVTLTGDERKIVRFMNERQFILDISRLVITTETIERQCAFSDTLRENGLLVPQRYLYDGHYCMDYRLDGIPCDVTVESWLENTQPRFRQDMFGPLGRLIGKIHHISELEHCRIGFSIVYNEVEKGAMDFMRLFSGTDTSLLPAEDLHRLQHLHDEKKTFIAAIWPKLPKSSVQGDIYSCNNLAWQTDGTPGFYDFNIAADEVHLGDMLHAWFRTAYDVNYEAERQSWDLPCCWEQYLAGYTEIRPFTILEKQALGEAYALLGAIYAAKYAAEQLRRGETEQAVRAVSDALEYLE